MWSEFFRLVSFAVFHRGDLLSFFFGLVENFSFTVDIVIIVRHWLLETINVETATYLGSKVLLADYPVRLSCFGVVTRVNRAWIPGAKLINVWSTWNVVCWDCLDPMLVATDYAAASKGPTVTLLISVRPLMLSLLDLCSCHWRPEFAFARFVLFLFCEIVLAGLHSRKAIQVVALLHLPEESLVSHFIYYSVTET